MTTIEAKLAALEERLRKVEDELEIYRLLVRYGMAADTANPQATADVFTEDGIYDVNGISPMVGHAGVKAMITGPGHQSLVPNAGHTVGPLAVKIDGDKAVAYGYSRTYLKTGDDIKAFRLAYNRIDLERRKGHWRITNRKNRMVGTPEAQAIFREGVKALAD